MNDSILNNLKENRNLVEDSFSKFLNDSKGKNYNTSKAFYFKVVFSYFEEMSTVMSNKILKGQNYVFMGHLWKAIEKAEYACAKGERQDNKELFMSESAKRQLPSSMR